MNIVAERIYYVRDNNAPKKGSDPFVFITIGIPPKLCSSGPQETKTTKKNYTYLGSNVMCTNILNKSSIVRIQSRRVTRAQTYQYNGFFFFIVVDVL